MGGLLKGVQKLNISLDGLFTVYPPARLQEHSSRFEMNSITILDGGKFMFMGKAEDENKLEVILDGGLHVQGGGELEANYIHIEGNHMEVIILVIWAHMTCLNFIFPEPEARGI